MLVGPTSTPTPDASRNDGQPWTSCSISRGARGILWLRWQRRPGRHAPAGLVSYLSSPVFWTLLALMVGVLAGLAAAGFLWALDRVTQVYTQQPWSWLLALPVVGFAVGWLYHQYGGRANGGTEAVLAEVRQPTQPLPWQMAPLVLLGTLLTHLCGGSVGREGTAIQMSAALADRWSAWLALRGHDRRTLLTMGISAGFAGLFGTPWAAALCAIELPAVGGSTPRGTAQSTLPATPGRPTLHPTAATGSILLNTKKGLNKKPYGAGLLSCLGRIVAGLVAAFCADGVCRATGASHAAYPASPLVTWEWLHLIAAIGFGLLCGVLATAYHGLHRACQAGFQSWIRYPPVRPLAGGLVVILLVGLLGTTRYNGLGLPVIEQALREPVEGTAFVWKTVLTTWTLAAGFKGGEVTPLFFMGATFGNALHGWVPLPLGLLASLGFVAVFAGVTRTPWTCTVMGCELFGFHSFPFFALANLAAAHGIPIFRDAVLNRYGCYRNRDSAD